MEIVNHLMIIQNLFPIVPKNKIFNNNSIKNISFEYVKNKIKSFLHKNNF